MHASILFVDDDANVLMALRRMLHPMRNEWQMSFASSGQQALAILSQAPFDVVVSDVLMPLMTGSELLTEVRRRYPHTARIILSGQSNRDLTVQAAGPAHQYLSKPCDPEVLKKAIGTVCDLQRLLSNVALRRVVSRLQSIPSLPQAYQEVLQELESEDVSLPRVGRSISQDPGMSAKVLQLVNSGFFGLPRRYSSPEEAAVLLGADTLRSLILGAHVFSQFEGSESSHVSFGAIWKHSIRVSRIGQALAASVGAEKGVVVHAATAGLLHDIGLLALAATMPSEFREVVKLTRQEKKSLLTAELQVLSVTHAQAGAFLMGLWGLPDPIVEAILLHHAPTVGSRPGFTPLTATHVADCLALDPMSPDLVVSAPYLRDVGMADRLAGWQRLAHTTLEVEGRPA